MTASSQLTIKKIGGFVKKNIIFISIGLIIAFFIILAVLGVNFGQWLANTVLLYYEEFGDFGIYLGIFLISIFGNFTIIFPVPYIVALIVVSAIIPGVNPILIGFVGALGASIGEVSAWLIGRGGKNMIGEGKNITRMKSYVEKGWAPLLIFIFAATPLPDDAFLIVLGIMGYGILKALLFCFLGKFVLCFLSSALPIWFADTQLGDFLFGLFGIDLEAAREGIVPPSTMGDIVVSSIMWTATLIILLLFVYIDWGALIKKIGLFRKKISKEPKKTRNSLE
ncbi:MAG: putative membrane-associated protein (modular protein) [Promethearchaeota archaeon]|nr:MAG: putative membrane-associated protein (modular protein) [Candidatus Lokiarchaeota archaeon]